MSAVKHVLDKKYLQCRDQFWVNNYALVRITYGKHASRKLLVNNVYFSDNYETGMNRSGIDWATHSDIKILLAVKIWLKTIFQKHTNHFQFQDSTKCRISLLATPRNAKKLSKLQRFLLIAHCTAKKDIFLKSGKHARGKQLHNACYFWEKF